jgi:hypothetical protein
MAASSPNFVLKVLLKVGLFTTAKVLEVIQNPGPSSAGKQLNATCSMEQNSINAWPICALRLQKSRQVCARVHNEAAATEKAQCVHFSKLAFISSTSPSGEQLITVLLHCRPL